MKLVFIHGRSQGGKNPVALLKEWHEAWKIGLKAARLAADEVVDIKLPFYGDTLDKLVTDADAGLLENVRTRGAKIDSRELAFKFQFLDEVAKDRGITASDIDENYEGPARERGPLNWGWVQAILQTVDDSKLGARSLDRFTHDVWVYLNNKAVRRAIDGIVAAELTGGPCVVVGHSLGSIVGYNVLRAAGTRIEVPRYITVGSPLGVRAVQNLLDLPLAMPECVADWYNAMDDADVVALRPLDDEVFPIEPAIRNKTTVKNRTDNHHGIIGYLDDPDVAREIYTALRGTRAGGGGGGGVRRNEGAPRPAAGTPKRAGGKTAAAAATRAPKRAAKPKASGRGQ